MKTNSGADLTIDAIADLQKHLRDFARERDWDRYHSPQNLAALISSEAGELLALFRWGQDSIQEKPDRVRQEIADVFLGILRFADVAGIDLIDAGREKLAMNRERYPIHRTRGPDRPSPVG